LVKYIAQEKPDIIIEEWAERKLPYVPKVSAEFTVSIISQLKDLWPECKVVHEKPRHPQSQGSVERVNADIKDMTV
jgi:hypothetical protein